MEAKYIHYCWFGDKPLSKLAKKCIKSWEKYLPDYKIIKWSEENVNFEECPFISGAYKNKKWAFVADYARTKALKEMGGIYFDTDMLIKKDILPLLNDKSILGFEDSHMVNAALWYEPKNNGYIPTKLLEYYNSQKEFDVNDIYSYSIPRLITKILLKLDLDTTLDEIQELKHNIKIYPREYFYPLSYNYRNNVFTENTYAIHYFDATWLPKWEQRENKLIRKFGEKNALRIIKLARFTKKSVKNCARVALFPITLKRRHDRKYPKKYFENINNCVREIPSKKDYIVLVNKEWFGVYNATCELFQDNVVVCGELKRTKDVKKVGEVILSNKDIKQVIFSAMCIGWKDLIIYLKSKNKNIKIKTFWHGNHSQVFEPYGWERNEEIFDLHKQGYIDLMGTCKKSLIPFYDSQKFKSFFLTNVVNDNIKYLKQKKYDDGKVHIGIYAAKSDDWRKNMFTSIAAASLVPNAVLDMVPLNNEAIKFANLLHIPITGVKNNLERDELIKRMSKNDINLYVTFSECAPMVILESFSVDTVCISGNNHHYFKDGLLNKYTIVNNESSPVEIKEKIELCLKNNDKLLKEYKEFEKINKEESIKQVKEFLER